MPEVRDRSRSRAGFQGIESCASGPRISSSACSGSFGNECEVVVGVERDGQYVVRVQARFSPSTTTTKEALFLHALGSRLLIS